MCTKQFVKSDNRNGGFNGFKVLFYDYNYELGFVCQSVTRIEITCIIITTFRWLYVVMKRAVIKTDAFFFKSANRYNHHLLYRMRWSCWSVYKQKRNILNQGGVIMLVHIRILYRFSRKRHIQERNQIHIQHTPYTSTHQSAGMSYQYTPSKDRIRLYLCFMHSRVKKC